jgi:subtilisin family serine protease
MRAPARKILWIASLALALAAHAQVLPRVQLPGVQIPSLPVDPALRGVGDTLTLPTRAVRSQRLLEQHRAELDRDSRGDLVVRAEVVAIDITDAALAKARHADFLVKRTQELPDLGVKITVLKTPEGWSARRGLAKLRKLDPEGSYDFNHVYLDSGGVIGGVAARDVEEPATPATPGGGASARVGLIDGGIDASHAALRGNPLHEFGCDGTRVASEHGTAVASLLAGSAVRFHGAAPRAELFVADVYCNSPTGGAVDAVAAAFGWMARERVPVINVSLVGPRNALLERAVKVLVSRGILIVAAVGNDGPASPPLFPAAYDGVVAVTAVDAKRRVLLEACRGKHVRLSAPGADIAAAVAGTPDSYGNVRGTSFAAPIVAGLLARELREPDPIAAARSLAALSSQAIDLGPRGRDDVYGVGLVGDSLAVEAPRIAIK